MFWNRFYELCLKRGTKPNPLAKELGISSGVITKWKSGSIPSGEMLNKIADYLGCSVDYLLGRTDNSEVNKNKQEVVIMDNLYNIDFEKILSDVLSKIDRNNQKYLSEHPNMNTKQYEDSAKIAANICLDILKAYHAELIKNQEPH